MVSAALLCLLTAASVCGTTAAEKKLAFVTVVSLHSYPDAFVSSCVKLFHLFLLDVEDAHRITFKLWPFLRLLGVCLDVHEYLDTNGH